ncbi:hypothetical protein AOXY_G22464, partial [Acipenser oxyrinchus oxyrinchus]
MEPAVVALFVCRSLVCVLGIIGNGALLVSLLKQSGFKTFEIFLAGMASSNLVESFLVDIPDLLTELAGLRPERWFCKVLKFMSGVGETGSILFTLLICVFRYQKLRDAATRVSLPTVLDRVRNAWLLSAVSWVVAFSFSLPSALMELPKEDQFVSYGQGNETDSRACSSDLFDCPLLDCSLGRQAYKMAYMLLLNGLPLVIVLVCSFLMVKVLYHNHKALSDQPLPLVPSPAWAPGRQAAFRGAPGPCWRPSSSSSWPGSCTWCSSLHWTPRSSPTGPTLISSSLPPTPPPAPTSTPSETTSSDSRAAF